MSSIFLSYFLTHCATDTVTVAVVGDAVTISTDVPSGSIAACCTSCSPFANDSEYVTCSIQGKRSRGPKSNVILAVLTILCVNVACVCL